MKREFVLVLSLFLLSSVLAGISISEPNEIYNLADRLYVNLDGLRGSDSGNLNIDLVCDKAKTNLVKISARAFSGDVDQSYSIPYKILNLRDLEIGNLTSIIGNCQIVASLGSQVASSNSFIISKDVSAKILLDKTSYNPGDDVTFSIKANKANGNALNGFVEVSGIVNFNEAIEDGVAENVFSLDENLAAGNYRFNVSFYDVGSEGKLNSGSEIFYLNVAQVASSMSISLSDEVATPDVNFSIGSEIFDQSGEKMSGAVLLRIFSPKGEEIQADLSAGDFGNIKFPLNSSVGIWRIVAEFNGLSSEREFEMLGIQRVDFDLEDSILTVRNIGNSFYNKTVSIDINGNVLTLDLALDIHELKKFDLEAPTGEYQVVIGDGDSILNKQVLLTGDAISVEDLKSFAEFKNYSFIWIFLIVILFLTAFLFFMKYRKTKTLGKINVKQRVKNIKNSIGNKIAGNVSINTKKHANNNLNLANKSSTAHIFNSKNHNSEDDTMMKLSKTSASAESSLVLKGEKLISSIVSLSFRNYGELSNGVKEMLQKTITNIKGKGLLDWRGDYVFVVFSPLVTKTYNNEILATNCAMKINENLQQYNRKFKEKIKFGIGVHSGELVASKAGEKLKYTSIGNTISFAKRMSDSDSNNVIISEEIKSKLMRNLKVAKGKEIGEKTTFIVEEIRDGVNNQAKLKELLKRQNS